MASLADPFETHHARVRFAFRPPRPPSVLLSDLILGQRSRRTLCIVLGVGRDRGMLRTSITSLIHWASAAGRRIPRSTVLSAQSCKKESCTWACPPSDMPSYHRDPFVASTSFCLNARISSNRLVTSRMIAASPTSSPVSARNGIIVNSREIRLPSLAVPGTASTSP